MKCICCGQNSLKPFFDLGVSPLANSHLVPIKNQVTYPLSIEYCVECEHVQIGHRIDTSKIFNSEYTYLSGQSTAWIEHCTNLSNSLSLLLHQYPTFIEKTLLEIGSNDGTLLELLKIDFPEAMGVEPSLLPAQTANSKGLHTLNRLFDQSLAKELVKNKQFFSLILSTNVFAHTSDPLELLVAASEVLLENGLIIIEVQSGEKLLDEHRFDMIYHEHYSYYTPMSLNRLAKLANLELLELLTIDTHGGSFRAIMGKVAAKPISTALSSIMLENPNYAKREIASVSPDQRITPFSETVNAFYNELETLLRVINPKSRILGLGAPAKLTTLINVAPPQIKASLIEKLVSVADSNPVKQRGWIPGTDIPIIPFPENRDGFDFAWIFSWNYSYELQEIAKRLGFMDSEMVVINIEIAK
jgi:SAM-dependent methyltransferase